MKKVDEEISRVGAKVRIRVNKTDRDLFLTVTK